MCDFSLMHAKSRPAEVADKLVTKDFGRGTTGFAPALDADKPADESIAVCVLPGTEIAFDKPVEIRSGYSINKLECQTARFRQIDTESAHKHHDALEFATGEIIKLTTLHQGQTATVLQLPAKPKNEQEAKEQERLEIVA